MGGDVCHPKGSSAKVSGQDGDPALLFVPITRALDQGHLTSSA